MIEDPFHHLFAEAKRQGLLLAAFYQIDDGRFRVKFRRKNGDNYDFSGAQMSPDPRDALQQALLVAINTLPKPEDLPPPEEPRARRRTI